MTKNQIDYMNAVETARWHAATEQENQRHNREDERIRDYANQVGMTNARTNQLLAQEQERHNRVTEWLTDQYNRSSIALNHAHIDKAYSDIYLNSAKAGKYMAQGNLFQTQANIEQQYGAAYKLSQIKANDASTILSKASAGTRNAETNFIRKKDQYYWSTDVLPSYAGAFKDITHGIRDFVGTGTDIAKTVIGVASQ